MNIYAGHSGFDIGSIKVKAFERLGRIQYPNMLRSGMLTINGDENVVMYFPILSSDLVNYPTNDISLSYEYPHRYFHPPFSSDKGIGFMRKVPKARVSFHRLASPGDPIHITWYFWTKIEPWRILGNSIPNSIDWQTGIGFATETAVTVEPIPDTNWELPSLAPLPHYFNSTTGTERLKHLIRRA